MPWRQRNSVHIWPGCWATLHTGECAHITAGGWGCVWFMKRCDNATIIIAPSTFTAVDRNLNGCEIHHFIAAHILYNRSNMSGRWRIVRKPVVQTISYAHISSGNIIAPSTQTRISRQRIMFYVRRHRCLRVISIISECSGLADVLINHRRICICDQSRTYCINRADVCLNGLNETANQFDN